MMAEVEEYEREVHFPLGIK